LLGAVDLGVLRFLTGGPSRREARDRLARLHETVTRVAPILDWFSAPPPPGELTLGLESAARSPGAWRTVVWPSDARPRLAGPHEARLLQASNALARCQVRRGASGAPALLLVHGHLLGEDTLQRALLPWRGAASEGWTVVLLTLPLHGQRHVRGAALPGSNPVLNLEAVAQGVRDLLQLDEALRGAGVAGVLWGGQSLGGLAVSLAAMCRQPAGVALLSPLLSLARLAFDGGALGVGAPAEELLETLSLLYAPVTPTAQRMRVPASGWFVSAARDDRITPMDEVKRFARELNVPVRWHSGSHLVPLGEGWHRRGFDAWRRRIALPLPEAPR